MASPASPIRGVWIANLPHGQALASPENIRQTLAFLQEIGFNTIFPVVWNRGYTLFPSDVLLDRGFQEIDPYFDEKNFDPLTIITECAKEFALEVIPWFEYGFAASHLETGGQLLTAYPAWAAIDSRGNRVKHGGLVWMNALDREVQDFLLELVLEVAKKYDIDGIQGCDRFPALPVEGGYNPEVIARYRRETNPRTIPASGDSRWVRWRSDRLTDFLERLYREVKAIDPKLIVSLSPAVYPFCLNHLLQDPKAWIDREIVDYLHPQIYRDSFSAYQAEARKQKNFFPRNDTVKIAPGVAFTANGIDLDTGDIEKILDCNRRLGFDGEVFFHYEGLRKNSDRLAIALQDFFG